MTIDHYFLTARDGDTGSSGVAESPKISAFSSLDRVIPWPLPARTDQQHGLTARRASTNKAILLLYKAIA
jgi:hypothetical protein